jgi:exonuclease SbcD
MASKTVVVVGDSHYCEDSRFEECIRLHDEIVDWVANNKPDLVMHTGDLFDRESTPKERDAAAQWLQDCASVSPVVVVGGNHDAPMDIEFMARLKGMNSISAYERPMFFEHQSGIALALLPWPRKANLLAALGNVPQEQAGQAAQDALRNVLRGMSERVHDGPKLFAGHVMMRGSVTSHGQPLVGMDMELGLDDLALVDADAYALGHVHMRQSWWISSQFTGEGNPCFYPGAPRRTAFGELEAKGFTVVRFTKGPEEWQATTEFIELAATPMVLMNLAWDPLGQALVDADGDDAWALSAKNAEVRVRYTVDSDQRDAAKAEASRFRDLLMNGGAVSVKLEPIVNVTTRSRAPEVAQAATLGEQLQAYWAAKNTDPGQRRQPLLDKLAQLETVQ